MAVPAGVGFFSLEISEPHPIEKAGAHLSREPRKTFLPHLPPPKFKNANLPATTAPRPPS